MDVITITLAVTSFILAGLLWTTAGYVKNWRENHNNPDWKGFDKKSLRNDLILGLILGIGGVIYAIIEGDLETWVVPTAQEFFQSIGANVAAVALVDKLFIGGILKK